MTEHWRENYNTCRHHCPKDGLVIQEMPDEVLVYDLNSNKAIALIKLRLSSGKPVTAQNPLAKSNALMEREFGENISEEMIWLSVDLLNKDNLLDKINTKFKRLSTTGSLLKIWLNNRLSLCRW